MVAMKLKILWLFLTIFRMGCVKSEEDDLELHKAANSNLFKIMHPLDNQSGALNASNLGEKNNSNENEDENNKNIHTDNINEDISKGPYDDDNNYMDHVNGTSTNFTDMHTSNNNSDEYLSEGSGDGLLTNNSDNQEQNFKTETSDIDSQDNTNTTVEDIFKNGDVHFKYPKPEMNTSDPNSDLIERWLTAAKENSKPNKGSLDETTEQPNDFDANHTSYDHSSSTINQEEKTGGSRFVLPEESNTEQEHKENPKLEEQPEGTHNPGQSNTERDHDEKIFPANETQTSNSEEPTTELQHEIKRDSEEEIEISSEESSTEVAHEENLHRDEQIGSNHNSSHLEQPNIEENPEEKVQPAETENNENVTLLQPANADQEVPLQKQSSINITYPYGAQVKTDEHGSPLQEQDQTNQSTETIIDNHPLNINNPMVKIEQENNNPAKEHGHEVHPSNLPENVNKTHVEKEEQVVDPNTSASTHQPSISNDLGKSPNDDNSAESQISKPLTTVLPIEEDTTQTTTTPTTTTPQNGEEDSFHTSNDKLTTTMGEIKKEQYSDGNKSVESNKITEQEKSPDLLENEKDFNVTTESRTSFIEDDNDINMDSMNRSLSEKLIEYRHEYSYFDGRVYTDDGAVLASLILTMKMFVNNTKIHLPQNISAEEIQELQNTEILLRWEASDILYNISSHFDIRCKDEYCSLASIHLRFKKRTNNEIFELHNGINESVEVQGNNLELFKTKLGSFYQNNAETILSMSNGVKIYLANVEFFVAKDPSLNHESSANSAGIFSNYYTELIGGSVGIILIVGIALFAIKKLRNSNESFKPNLG